MRLKIIRWLEETISHREADKSHLGRASITRHNPKHDEQQMLDVMHKNVVDYRLHIGARAKVSPHAMREGHDRVFRILCRELFGELVDEIYQLEEWAYLEGYDDDIVKRIQRLANLAKGEEVRDAE